MFVYNWYFKADNNYKNQIKLLKESNKNIQFSRDSISISILNLENSFKIIKSREDSLINKINKLDIQVSESKRKANKSKIELESLRKELLETNKRIVYLESNPSNRNGQDLINSIKNKTQK